MRIGSIMAPQRCPHSNSCYCKYGKGFVDVIKVRILRGRSYLGLSSWILRRMKQEIQVSSRRVDDVGVMGLRGREPEYRRASRR